MCVGSFFIPVWSVSEKQVFAPLTKGERGIYHVLGLIYTRVVLPQIPRSPFVKGAKRQYSVVRLSLPNIQHTIIHHRSIIVHRAENAQIAAVIHKPHIITHKEATPHQYWTPYTYARRTE